MPEVVASDGAVRSKLSLLSPELNYICHLTNPAYFASQIEAKIWQWITVKAKTAIPGDVINIVVCGHGDPQRLGFCAGYHRIFPFEMDEMLGKFKQGVMVNVISGAGNSDEKEECSLDQIVQPPRTHRARQLNERFLGPGFSNLVTHSLSLLRPCGIPQPNGDRSKV